MAITRRGLAGLVGAAVAGAALSTEAQAAGPVTDRQGGVLAVGMFVYVPCLITSITPSLNPALTSIGVQTFPNVGAEYDEGLPLLVYPSQVIKA